jgi:cold shock CspA family protein
VSQVEAQPFVVGQPSYNSRLPINPRLIRYTGKIKLYDEIKGFGFIICESDKREYYFTKNDIRTRFDNKTKPRVNFSLVQTYRGFQATDIRTVI